MIRRGPRKYRQKAWSIVLFPGLRPLLRRYACTGLLVTVPWLPGLLAVPMLAAAGHPVLGKAPAPGTQVHQPASPPASTEPDRAAGGAAPGPATPDPRPPAPLLPAPPEKALVPATVRPGEVWVDVDLTRQRVRVLKEKEIVREMIASTGVPDKPTPQGSFRLQNRGEWFFSEKYKQGGFFWVSFLNNGEYLFHSIPTDRERRFIPEEAGRLGQPASHGCVRLSLEDARWIYEELPTGTRVEIHT